MEHPDNPSSCRPRVEPVCPACRAALSVEKGAANCPPCGIAYPLRGTAVDFLPDDVEGQKEEQRAIYEGEQEAGIRLTYLDEDEHRKNLDDAMDNLDRYGLPGLTMRDAMNMAVFKKAGFRRGMEVLDVGSGSGMLLNTLARRYGVRGTGIDISSVAIGRSLACNPLDLSFHLADAERLPFPDASFDRVVSFDVIEHLADQRGFLAEAHRVVKPGGRILFYGINLRDDYTWHWAQRKISGGRLGTHEAGGHTVDLFLKEEEVTGWLEELGFSGIQIRHFHAFFTLMVDERLMCLNQALGRSPFFFKLAFHLCRSADLPMTAAGLSNGFYFMADKGDG
jgi:2-polyprenyl-3-methyl-5-hydroxy-6-metoxy-1,4-benzoquinol methylase